MMLLAAVLMGLTLTACNQNKQTTNDDMNTTFTGESGGEPRRMASPDINTADFLAAIDFLSNSPMPSTPTSMTTREGTAMLIISWEGTTGRFPTTR